MLADVFKSDLFSFTSLTSAVNAIPYVPQELQTWLPWNAEGVETTSVVIESQDGVLTLIPAVPRGAPASQDREGARKAFSLLVPHYPRERTIMASSIQGVRQFGSDSELETVEAKIAQAQAQMVRQHESTWEFGRACAITGVLKNADGSTLIDLNAAQGVVQNQYDIDFATATTDVKDELIVAKERSEDEQSADTPANGYALIAGRAMFHTISRHASLKTAFDRWRDGQALRADNRFGGMIIGDNITLYSAGRGKVGGVTFIADDEAYLCPIAPGMYQTRFAPADTVEAANTTGLPLYSMSDPLPYGRGVKILTESNAISYTTTPRAIIKIKQSA
jgi:hypothetical protein